MRANTVRPYITLCGYCGWCEIIWHNVREMGCRERQHLQLRLQTKRQGEWDVEDAVPYSAEISAYSDYAGDPRSPLQLYILSYHYPDKYTILSAFILQYLDTIQAQNSRRYAPYQAPLQ